MAKFDITDWSDFVRGIASPEDEEKMQRLLEPSATEASSAAGVVEHLRQVASLGKADHEAPVPSYAVRIAKAIASVRRQKPEIAQRRSPFRRLRCTAAFDSFLQPAPVGTRDLDRSHRTLTFEAESYRINLRLEHELEPRSTVAVGQVMQPSQTEAPLSRVPVLVFAGQDEIDRTLTSAFGEFQFEGLPQQALELCLLIGEDFVELPLDLASGTAHEAGL